MDTSSVGTVFRVLAAYYIGVNDAIIKVDFINQRRERGMDLRQAIEAAGRARSLRAWRTLVVVI